MTSLEVAGLAGREAGSRLDVAGLAVESSPFSFPDLAGVNHRANPNIYPCGQVCFITARMALMPTR